MQQMMHTVRNGIGHDAQLSGTQHVSINRTYRSLVGDRPQNASEGVIQTVVSTSNSFQSQRETR